MTRVWGSPEAAFIHTDMRKLIIIGAGGFGREVLEWAISSSDHDHLWTVKGFIDDAPESRLAHLRRAPILGSIVSYQIEPGDVFICGIGTPQLRRKIQEHLIEKGAEFVSIIHPTATVCSSAKIGCGVVVCPYALVSTDASVGDGSVIYYHASVDHDVTIGRYCQISGHCDIAGAASLGEEVFLGSHSVILPGITVAKGSTVGAGAVVTKNVRSGVIVYGVPAREKRNNIDS